MKGYLIVTWMLKYLLPILIIRGDHQGKLLQEILAPLMIIKDT